MTDETHHSESTKPTWQVTGNRSVHRHDARAWTCKEEFPKLSVVVANYNHGAHLAKCLEAILTQSVAPFEVIVVDDASTDNSVEIITDFTNRHANIKLRRNYDNHGAVRAFNHGMQCAVGDYVVCCAADDEVMPGFFEKSLRMLAAHPEAGACAGICRCKNLDNGTIHYYGLGLSDQPRFFSPPEMIEAAQAGKLVLFTSVMILRRNALLEVHNYIPQLRWHVDWFACFAVAFRYGLCFVPEVLGEFRSTSTGYSRKGMMCRKDQVAVLRGILDLLVLEENRDIAAAFCLAGSLAPFGKEMLWLVVANRQYRRFLTPFYLRTALWWSLRLEVKKVAPTWFIKLYFRLAGYSSPSAEVEPKCEPRTL